MTSERVGGAGQRRTSPSSAGVGLEFKGRAAKPERLRLPPVLGAIQRSTAQAEDPFLPAGYLEPTRTFDLAVSARTGEADAQKFSAAPEELVALELRDGSTLLTSAARLQASIAATHPELLGEDGSILVEKLATGAPVGRGLAESLGGLVSKIYTFIAGSVPDAILDSALDKLEELIGTRVSTELGVTWAGTKALMWAVESRLSRENRLNGETGALLRWRGGSSPRDLTPAALGQPLRDPEKNRMLVFIHGTASSTLGSFGDLGGDRELWGALERRFPGGIFGFEHFTLSESPIENALLLAKSLPKGAHVSLVTHSRGGLVGDLLCLGPDLDRESIARYARVLGSTGDTDRAESERVKHEVEQAHTEHREKLEELGRLLRERELVLERYVRIASPANGTKLASGNFDVFLSGLLTLIGQVPYLFGNPVYAALKRVVIEIAKNRTNPHLVPGIEAMLPDSALARLLSTAKASRKLSMGVIAGDIEGGNLLQRLGILLTDFLFYDREDNDLVVNTSAMLAGIAPRAGARALLTRGANVSHFRYFVNPDTRSALRDFLVKSEPEAIPAFSALPRGDREILESAFERTRAAADPNQPIVVVLPGIMGTHLKAGDNRIWLDPWDLVGGGLSKISWGRPNVAPDELFGLFYARLCEHLSATHRVERFPYDWRQPLDVLADRLNEFLIPLLNGTKPVRLLAHSMGGLVVRACYHRHRGTMDALMQREGARFVMLGTPNQGSHSMVENLVGKGDAVRMLAVLDAGNDLREILSIVAGFRGALQLLPRPGFKDTFQGDPEGGAEFDFQETATWSMLANHVRDFWFGDGVVGLPAQDALEAGSWLWEKDGRAPALPAEYASKTAYVCGMASNTVCGVRVDRSGRLKLVGTGRGDGTVTWDSGRIDGIGAFYYMPAKHGDLANTPEHFAALTELLTTGKTKNLPTKAPITRGLEAPVSYDAGPPSFEDPENLERRIMGGTLDAVPPQPMRSLEVAVKVMDLRFVDAPILVGHYERDPIAGAEALIDRELLHGDLSVRRNLGLYPGARGTAEAVLRAPNEVERKRGSLRGAVVTGLGPYDRPLSKTNLTEAVRAGAYRYLLHVLDVLGRSPRQLRLASLLLGYNSSANLRLEDSVEAVVRGVLEANTRFRETTNLDLRISELTFVELYLDTANTAVHALRGLEEALQAQAKRLETTLRVRAELERGEGARQRLFNDASGSYWPRLHITGATQPDSPGASKPDGSPGAAAAPTGRAPVANQLQFLFVGQRARAEAVLKERQPGLLELLVQQQLAVKAWQPSIGRALFQQTVPDELKDSTRHLQRAVLVVDDYTANLPWELMVPGDPTRIDDQEPLAIRTALVRQLSSTSFYRELRYSIERSALVVGNPSVENFAAHFPAPPGKPPTPELPQLEGAEAEAEAVARVLQEAGYAVTPIIGAELPASEIITALSEKAWRILHVSAHGIFNLRHVDGQSRSGVVLSNGVLITAAEIAGVEIVPELVFLNCCHLGVLDAPPNAHKLGASIARELINKGVRAVMVAGWAVTDSLAKLFGETFYQELLGRRRPFGEAVFAARKALWDANPQDLTWGAFQAYGDPGWLAEPRVDGDGRPRSTQPFACIEEFIDELSVIRVELSHDECRHAPGEARLSVDAITALLERCPEKWRKDPAIQSALAAAYRDLEDFPKARAAFLAAARAEDQRGAVALRDLEQLANLEARWGEKLTELEASGTAPQGSPSGQALIDLAIERLKNLDATTSRDAVNAEPRVNRERAGLLGSALKRKAALVARWVLQANGHGPPDTLREELRALLRESAQAYKAGEGDAESDGYLELNRLALEALLNPPDPGAKEAAVALAQKFSQGAVSSSPKSVFEAIRPADALLVERLFDGSLGAQDEKARESAITELTRYYEQAFANLRIKPNQLDSVLSKLDLLARFSEALATPGPPLERTAAGLRALHRRLLETEVRLTRGGENGD